jgi:hypothetical protein
MNATGFDASTIEEGLEPQEWPRSGGVGFISSLYASLNVYRATLPLTPPIIQTTRHLTAELAHRYSQPFDPLRTIRALHSINREIVRWQPFWEELGAALDTYCEGDKDTFLEWVKRYIEHDALDGLLRERLRERMPRTREEFYPHAFLYYLKHHKHRLRIIDHPTTRNQIRRRIKLFPSLEQALDVLRAGSERTREQMLDHMIQVTLHCEWDKPPPPGSDPIKQLVNEVGNLVRRQARLEGEWANSPLQGKEYDTAPHNVALWHTATPQEEKSISLGQRLVSLDDEELPELSKFFDDPSAFAAYAAVVDKLLLEWFVELARQRLTPHELEVFELRLSGLPLEEIATVRGVVSGTVRKQWYDIRHKLLA